LALTQSSEAEAEPSRAGQARAGWAFGSVSIREGRFQYPVPLGIEQSSEAEAEPSRAAPGRLGQAGAGSFLFVFPSIAPREAGTSEE